MSQTTETEKAVEAARAQPHKFVFMPRDASDELRQALTSMAAETGREILHARATTPAERAAQELASSDRPVVKRNDTRAFMKNLAGIARGDVGVE
jgi:predicted aconitase